jgi:glycosyltransferase involved in cell wall biosynthesis
MTPAAPAVSVVVPVRNGAATIDDCLWSLLELRYPGRLELLVVDNGSTDGTPEVLARHDERIVVVHEPTRGPAAARNAGLRGATGDVVAFTDADCVVDPDWLARLVVPLADPAVGIAGGRILARPPAGPVERFGEEIHDHRMAIEVYDPPYAITMSWASRREVLEVLGGFDEGLRRCEDVDLSYRIVQAGYGLVYVDEALVYHRNESGLPGLFGEGFAHGFYGVQARKRHERFLRRLGHAPVNGRAYAEIGSRVVDWARGRDRARSRCDAVFNSGKKAGKLAGSLRFRHVDL